MKITKPIYYIPHCIDTSIYHKKVKPLVKRDRFTFLFMGTWKERKGYKQLFEAWLREFTESDDVQLLVKTDRPVKAEQYLASLCKQMGIDKGFAPIIFENKVFDEKTLPQFIKSVDCLVAPTMGEGFGYPGLQCMALGIPVITTNFSGCQDYANEATATLLEPTGFVLRSSMDNIPQFKSRKWAFVEVKKVQKAMRMAINNVEKIKLKANTAYSYVRTRFSYEEVGKLFVRMLRDLYG